MHEVLVNRLGGLSLPRKSVVRLTDHPNMTLDVYRGRKTTIQQQQPIFPNSELLIWMLLEPNVTDHFYFDSVYLKIFTALFFFLETIDFCLLPMYCRLEDFFFLMFKKSSDLQHMDLPRTGSYMGSTERSSALDCAYPGYGRPRV